MRFGATLAALLFGGILATFTVPAIAQKTIVRHASRVLDTIQPDLKFEGVPLSEALDYIRDSSDINVVVDWKSLEAVNIDKNTLVNLHLRGVTLRKALNTILSEAGAGDLLTFYVEDNVLEITTQAKADTVMYTMVYSVEDLLVQIPQFQANDASSVLSSLSQGSGGGTYTVSNNGSGGGGGGGGSQQGSSNSNSLSGGSTSSSTNNQQTKTQAIQALVKLITDTIRSDIWKVNGGTANIAYYNSNLIITAPRSVLEAIGGPLE